MAIKPSLPKGTRDMLPDEMLKREYIINSIKNTFKKYGFSPIETPAFEKVETLTGKYGEEGDRLVFKILPRGRKLTDAINGENPQEQLPKSVEEALRYDLTVPLARFVVQNQSQLIFPFKRYQVQNVWRADRPQKGRFREFVQCDADALGSKSLLQEVDFVAIYTEVFEKLSLPVTVKINNRKILAGLAEAFGVANRVADFTIALDKLDKIGLEGVAKELSEKNFPEKAIEGLKSLTQINGSNQERLGQLEILLKESELGKKGLEELQFVIEACENLNLNKSLSIDFTLARGLDYYTGTIFEVVANDVQMGSIGGGGRYDDLTGIFGMKNLPGIGISFGLDRIQMVLEEKDLYPDLKSSSTQVLFINFGEREALFSLALAKELRDLDVKTEIYPDAAKIKKQMDYANKKGIRRVLMIGENEIKEGKFTLKDMESGEQQVLGKIELLELFNTNESRYGLH